MDPDADQRAGSGMLSVQPGAFCANSASCIAESLFHRDRYVHVWIVVRERRPEQGAGWLRSSPAS